MRRLAIGSETLLQELEVHECVGLSELAAGSPEKPLSARAAMVLRIGVVEVEVPKEFV